MSATSQSAYSYDAHDKAPAVTKGTCTQTIDPPGISKVVTNAVRDEWRERHYGNRGEPGFVAAEKVDRAGDSNQRNPYKFDESAKGRTAVSVQACAVER